MSYPELMRAERRLAILQILQATPGYTVNQTILTASVRGLGITGSLDQVRADIVWLAEQGLVVKEDLPDLYLAKLTSRGTDVAQGQTRVPGVAVPVAGD